MFDLRKKYQHPTLREARDVQNQGYEFIEAAFGIHFSEVTPDFVTKFELMEALLFAFIDHGLDPAKFNEMEEKLVKDLGSRRLRKELQ